MNGSYFYALRCAVLHNGNDDICKQSVLRGYDDEVDLFFRLIIPKNTYDIGVSLFFHDPESEMNKHKIIKIDSRIICMKIVAACKSFINLNPNIEFNTNIITD